MLDYQNSNPQGTQPNGRTITRTGGWKGRFMQQYGGSMFSAPSRDMLITPNWVTSRPIVFFFVALVICFAAFGYVPEFGLWLTASISVILFFYGASSISKSWSHAKEKTFLKNIFVAGLVVRLIWVLYCGFVFNPIHYGDSIGDKADVDWYMPFGQAIAEWVQNGMSVPFGHLMDRWSSKIDDVGYPIWLGIVYWLFGAECPVLIFYILKSIMGAYCAVCVYHVAKRHFGIGTARMAAIFICLNPNMIYWCGNMMKEAEMVFLCCICLNEIDKVLSSGRKMTFKSLLPGVSAAISIFFFRASLAIVIFLAMGAHIIMVSNRVMSLGKKILASLLVVTVLLIGMGERIREQSSMIIDTVQNTESNHRNNLEFRASREGGNSYAKYAGVAVFAPLIFTIPFPTFNAALEEQLVQIQLAGGSYIKNLFSYFVIIVLLLLIVSGEWRKHVFIIAYTGGYLSALVFSNFAQSGRFHMPVIPLLMLFAAYGIQLGKTTPKIKRWFSIVLVVEVAVCIAWNWFKLKGRGMI